MSTEGKLQSRLIQPQVMQTAAGGPLVSASTASTTNTPGVPTPNGASSHLSANRSGGDARTPRVITTKPQIPISDQELRARVQWSHRATPHFQIAYDRLSFAEPQTAALAEGLEEAYSMIFSMTHESFSDRMQVYFIDQRATLLLGRATRSHLNLEDRALYLVQTSSQHIFSELIRLLCHAMRLPRYTRHYGQTCGWTMLEESFSTFLNCRLSPLTDNFPFYGAEPDVVAHHLYQQHGRSLLTVWSECQTPKLEDLVLGGAFFLYLGDTFSDDRVVTFSKVDGEIRSSTFREFFSADLGELERTWAQHLPISRLALTHEECDTMILKWDQTIDCKRH